MHAYAQIRRLCESLTQKCPEGEAFERLLSEPSHVLARMARDIGAPDMVEKSLDHPMQVRAVYPVAVSSPEQAIPPDQARLTWSEVPGLPHAGARALGSRRASFPPGQSLPDQTPMPCTALFCCLVCCLNRLVPYNCSQTGHCSTPHQFYLLP